MPGVEWKPARVMWQIATTTELISELNFYSATYSEMFGDSPGERVCLVSQHVGIPITTARDISDKSVHLPRTCPGFDSQPVIQPSLLGTGPSAHQSHRRQFAHRMPTQLMPKLNLCNTHKSINLIALRLMRPNGLNIQECA